jgi:hypothetical protein
MEGPSVESIVLNSTTPVLGKGPQGSFDECGAWLQAVNYEGALIRAWYHAEEKCNYTIGQTRKSVAYAESTDGGITFTKPRYPYNQILTADTPFIAGQYTGNGDHSVIQRGPVGTYYAYFGDGKNSTTGNIALARSYPLSVSGPNSGLPGSWTKWDTKEPGIGGRTTPLDWVGTSASLYPDFSTTASIALLESEPFFGLKLHFSDDGILFRALQEPLLFVDKQEWTRQSTSGELVVYPSIVGANGGYAWKDSFYLYYLYISPGRGYESRYLVRRKVDVTYESASVVPAPQVKVALTRYYNSNLVDHWVTTTMVADTYREETTMGYLYTKPQPGMVKLEDCYIPDWNDHFIVAVNSGVTCESSSPKHQNLRTLGWAWSSPHTGSIPIYRCFWGSMTNHYISKQADCETTNPDVRNEGIIGYIPEY